MGGNDYARHPDLRGIVGDEITTTLHYSRLQPCMAPITISSHIRFTASLLGLPMRRIASRNTDLSRLSKLFPAPWSPRSLTPSRSRYYQIL